MKINNLAAEAVCKILCISFCLVIFFSFAFKVEAKIPQAGLAVIGETKGKEELISKVLEEYEKALNWYKVNPKEASQLVVKTLPMLEEEGLADSIEHVKFANISAENSKKDLEFFFEVLKDNDSKLIGGKLPNEGFYFK